MAKRSNISPPAGALIGLVWESASITYLRPNAFQLTGNRTIDYHVGLVVYVGLNRFSSVVNSYYTGTNTVVELGDAVCYSGMSLGKMPTTIGKNACVGGSDISSGLYPGYPASYAFDGLWSTFYLCLQGGSSIENVGYIGYEFASAKKIRGIRISNSTGIPASHALQYYNGSSWVTTQALAFDVKGGHIEEFIFDIPPTASTMWRILATSAIAAGYYWGVLYLEMFE